jgi:cytochrome c
MNNMKFNMIFAALLCAGIIAMLSGFAAKSLSRPAHLEEDAVKVEATEVAAGGAAKVAMPEPILGLIAAADAERGKAVAKACAACHNFEQGGPNGVGPNLYDIIGRKKESHAGFAYSGTLKNQGGDTWTYLELNKFIWKPKAYDPGTKMSFIGLKKPEDRTALMAYLRTLGTHPVPSQGEIDAEAKELAPPAEATPANAPADAAAPAKEEPKAH